MKRLILSLFLLLASLQLLLAQNGQGADTRSVQVTNSTGRLIPASIDFFRANSNSLNLSVAATGSVASVGLTAPSWLTISGSPVTTSGTLGLGVNGNTAPFGSISVTNLLTIGLGIVDLGPATNCPAVWINNTLSNAPAAANGQLYVADSGTPGGIKATNFPTTGVSSVTADGVFATGTITTSGSFSPVASPTFNGQNVTNFAANSDGIGTEAPISGGTNFTIFLGTNATFAPRKVYIGLTNNFVANLITNGPGAVTYFLTCVGTTNHDIYFPWNQAMAGGISYLYNSNFIASVSGSNAVVHLTNGQEAVLVFDGGTNFNPVWTNVTLVLGFQNVVAGGGAGSVTSVGLSGPAWMAISGSPVTSTGTLGIGVNGTTATFDSVTTTNDLHVGGSAFIGAGATQLNFYNAGGTVTGGYGTNLFFGPQYVGFQTNLTSTVIDWASATHFYQTISGTTTFSFANNLNTETIVVAVTGDASHTVAWPGGVKWQNGTAPTQTLSKTDIYTFIQVNGTIYGNSVTNF